MVPTRIYIYTLTHTHAYIHTPDPTDCFIFLVRLFFTIPADSLSAALFLGKRTGRNAGGNFSYFPFLLSNAIPHSIYLTYVCIPFPSLIG